MAKMGDTVFYHFINQSGDGDVTIHAPRQRPAIVVDVDPGDGNELELAVLFGQHDNPVDETRTDGPLRAEWRFHVPMAENPTEPAPGTWTPRA